MILPPAVQTDTPKDIYPLSLFIAANEVETMTESAEDLLSRAKGELLESG